MTSYLYRFRSVDRLLGKSNELERQDIYFASPEQLNDPLEGRKNIYWQGDLIIWENLFRHYLLCLAHAYGSAAINSKEQLVSWSEIPLRDPYGPAENPVMKKLHDQLFDAFFSNSAVTAYICRLAASRHRVRQAELGVHIRNVHRLALMTIDRVMRRGEPEQPPASEFDKQLAMETRRLRARGIQPSIRSSQHVSTMKALIDVVYSAEQKRDQSA